MKRIGLLFIVIMMFSLTGCIQKYDYTEAKSDEAAEYMAGLLLKYDRGYDKELIPVEEITGEASADNEAASSTNSVTVTETPSNSQNVTDNAAVASNSELNYTLNEVFGEKNFDLKYTKYQVVDAYPENASNEYFTITPGEGNQLLVVSFQLENTSKKKRSLDLTKSTLNYELDINSDLIYGPSLTLMENDLKYLNMEFEGGEEKAVILVFEIKKETDRKSINLTVSNGNKSEIINMK